ncbi:MAG: exodeoxyribonuclease VII small subunit [Propionibacteriaceae bacterium]|nr:exodeoxyribonuclease VII small subunit [Propionibacteriaceae bacterium]
MPKKTIPAAPNTSNTPSAPEPSYEQARAELIEVVTQLEAGQAPLAESIKLWERGVSLAATCQAWLDNVKAQIEQTVTAA